LLEKHLAQQQHIYAHTTHQIHFDKFGAMTDIEHEVEVAVQDFQQISDQRAVENIERIMAGKRSHQAAILQAQYTLSTAERKRARLNQTYEEEMDRIENIHRDGMDEVLFKTELAQGLLDENEELKRIDVDDLRKAKDLFIPYLKREYLDYHVYVTCSGQHWHAVHDSKTFQVPSLPVLEDGKDLACLGRWAKKILVPLHEAANELNRRPCSKCAPKFFINSDPNFTKSKYDDGTKWCRRGSEHQFNFKKQLYHASCCHILKNDSSGATLIDHYDDKWYPCLECHKTIAHIPQLER
jgi:hypothetical protein